MAIVFAGAASHAPGVTAWPEAAPQDKAAKFLGAYDQLRRRLEAARPDVLLAFTVEHWTNFFLNHMPAFCVGRAPSFDGPVEEWLRIPKRKVPGDPEFANALLEACYAGGFEVSFADEMLFDHATMLPLHFLTPKMDVPVVPIILNALAPPMPSPDRCYEFGALLRRWIEPSRKRVAAIATGGLSHWPGEAQAGKINSAFDKEFLDAMVQSNARRLRSYTHEEIAKEGGSGGHEVRTWIALRGMVPEKKGEVLAYEPIPPWATGCSVLALNGA
jgi:2,3-dihydroxyphenylpropionate 1,2-dioxygenase